MLDREPGRDPIDGLMDGMETAVVAFATDIPSLTAWGQPFLIGPGSIHVAHTENERISKAELMQAAEIYVNMVKKLKGRSKESGV